MDRYEEMLSRYKTDLDDAQVAAAVEKIVRDNLATNSTPDVYKFLFSCIDLTSLHTEDNTDSITKFTKRVNDFEEEHPEMPSVAAICVYPNFAGTVRANLDVSSVNIAAVSGGFPTSQTFTEVKVAETALALGDGICSTHCQQDSYIEAIFIIFLDLIHIFFQIGLLLFLCIGRLTIEVTHTCIGLYFLPDRIFIVEIRVADFST